MQQKNEFFSPLKLPGKNVRKKVGSSFSFITAAVNTEQAVVIAKLQGKRGTS